MTTKQFCRNCYKGLSGIALIVLCAIAMLGCHDEQIAPPNNEKTITFSLNVPKGFAPAASYALLETNENEVRIVDVMIFNKSNGSYVSGPHFGSVSGTDVTVRIPNDVIIANNDIEVFANCRSEIIAISPVSETKTSFLDKAIFTHAGKWNTDISDPNYKPIPMHGSLNATTSEVQLHRMLARVNVSPALDDFTLTSVHLVNYNTKGYIANRAATDDEVVIPTSAASTGFGSAIDYAAAGFINNDIYTFEAAAGASDATATNPCIIIGGTYKGYPNNYYRIDFVQDGTYLKIKRNHSYNFMITAISGSGYASAEVAFNNLPANVVYDISSWSDNNIVESSGQHLLSVSKSQFNFHSDAKTIDNGDNILTIETDHPQGWTASVVGTPAWLSLIGMDGSPVSGGAKGITPIKLALSANDTGSPRSADIKLVAGNVTYTVKVNQSNNANSDEVFVSEAAEYTMLPLGDKIFIPVSRANGGSVINLNSGDVFTAEISGTAGVIAKAAAVGVGKDGHVYVETGNALGTATVSIKKQGGSTSICTWTIKVEPEPESNSYIVAPGGKIIIPVSRANGSVPDPNDENVFLTQLDATTPFTTELVWTDNTTGIDANGFGSNLNSIAPYGTGSGGHILVKAGPGEGNAVVAIKNTSSQILWSWHIWVTSDTPKASGMYGYMDRNLGALNNGNPQPPANSTDYIVDIYTYGLLYQWGRKDPFPGPKHVTNVAGDNERTLFFGSGSTRGVGAQQYTVSTIGNQIDIATSVKSPELFVTDPSWSEYDWTSQLSGTNSTRWGHNTSTKSVYDPCPPGWRVPVYGQSNYWTDQGWSSFSNNARRNDNFGGVYAAAGYRISNTGQLLDIGTYGAYWSASPANDNSSYYHYFNSSDVSPSISYRTDAFTIRCRQE